MVEWHMSHPEQAGQQGADEQMRQLYPRIESDPAIQLSCMANQ